MEFEPPIVDETPKEPKDHHCNYHPTVKWDWHKNGRGKNVMGCPVCSGIATIGQGVTGPMHVYPDATYWRERPLNDKERTHRPRRSS